jgi:hypothetical protein
MSINDVKLGKAGTASKFVQPLLDNATYKNIPTMSPNGTAGIEIKR